MTWAVDTCVLIDVLEDDPSFGELSARTLDTHSEEGLVICPVTYVELAPAFDGDRSLQDEFLTAIGISYHEGWTWRDTIAAHAAWDAHIRRRRARQVPRRPIADLLIGSFALRFQGLVTRNVDDFQRAFPGLPLLDPSAIESRQEGNSLVVVPEAPEIGEPEAPEPEAAPEAGDSDSEASEPEEALEVGEPEASDRGEAADP